MTHSTPDHRFPRSHRLSGSRQFQAVFDARMRKTVGPLSVCALCNDLPHCRLGLSVPRRVGNAVKRNRIKRLLREAYRLDQNNLPVGYDLVVAVRPHAALTLADYRRLLGAAVGSLHRRLSRSHERP